MLPMVFWVKSEYDVLKYLRNCIVLKNIYLKISSAVPFGAKLFLLYAMCIVGE